MSTREYIGGRKLGRVAAIVYECGLTERRERGLGECEETWTLSRLVTALGRVCDVATRVTAGNFDRRRNHNPAQCAFTAARVAPAGLFETYKPSNGKDASK